MCLGFFWFLCVFGVAGFFGLLGFFGVLGDLSFRVFRTQHVFVCSFEARVQNTRVCVCVLSRHVFTYVLLCCSFEACVQNTCAFVRSFEPMFRTHVLLHVLEAPGKNTCAFL